MENKWAWIVHLNSGVPKHSEKHLVSNQEQLKQAEDRYLRFCGLEPATAKANDVVEAGVYTDGNDSYYLMLLKDFNNAKRKRSRKGHTR